MTHYILAPAANQYLIDPAILADLLHEVEPDLEERPESSTQASIEIVQPGLELLLAGFRQAWFIGSPLARQAAVRVLTGLANGQEPLGELRRPHLRAMVEGYRLAIKTTTGAAAARLFASNMLEGLA